MDLVFYTADVFTDKKFCGNQLAVFPCAEGLENEQMQAIAREFNLSETVFVFKPQDHNNTKRLRIFTPGAEVPFAGHPTVGAACVLASIGEIPLPGNVASLVLEEQVGNIPVIVRKNSDELYAELTTAIPPELRSCSADIGSIAAVVSLDVSDFATDEYPLRAVSCGLPFLCIPVRSLAAMRRIRINQAKWEAALKGEWEKQLYLFTRETVDEDCHFHARMFAMDLGFGEDPATGSAAAAFAGYFGQLPEIQDGPFSLVVEQGLEIHRPSKLFIGAEKRQGAVNTIRVGGNTVLVSKGMITL